MAYQASGAYTARFHHPEPANPCRSRYRQTCRESQRRCTRSMAGGATLFLVRLSLDEVLTDPFGPIWHVCRYTRGRQQLFENLADRPRLSESAKPELIESIGSGSESGHCEQPPDGSRTHGHRVEPRVPQQPPCGEPRPYAQRRGDIGGNNHD